MNRNKLSYFLALFIAVFFNSIEAFSKIVLDPGHGGSDQGAATKDIRESHLTLEIALKTSQLLRQKGLEVILTRKSDQHLSLAERAKIAREEGGSIFLSIHANSSEDTKAEGMEIYFENQLPADEESMFLANRENADQEMIKKIDWPLHPIREAFHLKGGDVFNIVQDLQRNYRVQTSSLLALKIAENWQGKRKSKENTIRQAPFFLVSNVNMPSALIELGFITNSEEKKRLMSSEYQSKISQGISQGLERFKEIVDKRGPTNLK